MNIGNALINTTVGKEIVPPLLQPPPANAPPLLLPQQIIVSSTIKTSAKNRIGYEELEDGEIVDWLKRDMQEKGSRNILYI